MSDTQLAAPRPLVKASTELSGFLGMEVSAMIDTIKAQCFKGKRPEEVTNEQLATYISVANALKLNPLLPGMMYPYPDRNGAVTVMLGPDGIFTLLANNPDIIAQKDGGPAFWTEHGSDAHGKDTCTGYINHRTKGLLKKTIWVDEWVVASNPNWNTRRHHQSEIRALKQAARMVIHGLPVDSDEHKLGEMLNVTDTGDQSATPQPEAPPPKRADPPARAKKGASAVQADSKAIDVDVVPAKAETPPPPVQEKPAEKVAEKVAEKSAEKVPEKAAPANGPIARTSLLEAEEITVKCVVKNVYVMNVNVEGVQTPSVHAKVEGEFTGPVYHFGAAKQGTGGLGSARPEWVAGNTVVLDLFGKINKKTGSVLAVVKKLEAAEEQTDTSAVDV